MIYERMFPSYERICEVKVGRTVVFWNKCLQKALVSLSFILVALLLLRACASSHLEQEFEDGQWSIFQTTTTTGCKV